MRITALFLLAALTAMAATSVGAETMIGIHAKISWVALHPNFPGNSKIIDGVKVYSEGAPMLVLRLNSTSEYRTFSMPYTDEKSKALFEVARSIPVDQEVIIYFAPSQKSSRTACKNYVAAGCVELNPASEDYQVLGLVAYPL